MLTQLSYKESTTFVDMADSKANVLDPHSARVVETNFASKGVWLVKVQNVCLFLVWSVCLFYDELNGN